MLTQAGIEFTVNPRLVRGLDYYTKTVFEWVTDELGAQNAVCGGGRYDGLIADIGGASSPAIGFAAGMERMVALLRDQAIEPPVSRPHAFMLAVGTQAERAALGLAETLRNEMPDLRLVVDAASGSFRAKMKRADRSEADLALIVGEDELGEGAVSVRHLRTRGEQTRVKLDELARHIQTSLNLA